MSDKPDLIFEVAGKPRSCRNEWWDSLEGSKPDTEFKCDGCSTSPDYWKHIHLWPACIVHDFHYREAIYGDDAAARQEADRYLYANVVALVAMQGGSTTRARALGWLYWGRVRVWGRKAYRAGEGTVKPTRWYHRIAEVWKRRE